MFGIIDPVADFNAIGDEFALAIENLGNYAKQYPRFDYSSFVVRAKNIWDKISIIAEQASNQSIDFVLMDSASKEMSQFIADVKSITG
jgi:hypothetical protein